MRVVRLLAALCVALLLHVVLAVAFYDAAPTVSSSAMGAGKAGLEIGLGLAGSYIDAIEQPAPEVETEEPAPPEHTKDKTPKEPALVAEAVQAVVEQDNTAATVVATSELEVEPPTPEKEVPAEPANIAPETAKPSAALQRATGTSADPSTGGKQGNSKDYFAELMAWLNQHKRYPREAKKEKQQGIVELQFTLLKDGTIIARSIKKGSEFALLDEAALNMLDNAAPLPPLPESMNREQITLVIPIEFSLITNQRYKE
jgi:protein TonB